MTMQRATAIEARSDTMQKSDSTSTVELSIIVPVFNESASVCQQIERLSAVQRFSELLIVDDGSSDGTTELLKKLTSLPAVRILHHDRNQGKGAAIRTALACATGSVIIIQDADAEYDPADIDRVVAPIFDGRADVVFGSRFATTNVLVGPPIRRAANRSLTWLSNRFTGLRLTDMETCYKAFRREVVTNMNLRENRFGIEPELTAKFARGGWRIMEVPISYDPRSRADGKKIGPRDGLRAIYCIIRYAWFE
jgi:glycosyltransferase involved in cell wall biosynthesis